MLLDISTLDVRQPVADPPLSTRKPSLIYSQAERWGRRAVRAIEWDMQVTEAVIGPVTQPEREPELA